MKNMTEENWHVPKLKNICPKFFIRVTGDDFSVGKVSDDISNTSFSIEVLKLLSPIGGEGWKSNNSYAITWRTNGTEKTVAKVHLYYTMDGGTTLEIYCQG
jgi:hypothetical protein